MSDISGCIWSEPSVPFDSLFGPLTICPCFLRGAVVYSWAIPPCDDLPFFSGLFLFFPCLFLVRNPMGWSAAFPSSPPSRSLCFARGLFHLLALALNEPGPESFFAFGFLGRSSLIRSFLPPLSIILVLWF